MTMEQLRISAKPYKKNIIKKLPCFVKLGLILTTMWGSVIATDNINKQPQAENSKFVPYYPKGCSITTHSCLCVQDLSKYRDVWYTQVNNSQMPWDDADGWATGLNINVPNPNGTCGIKNGWSLPNSIQMKYLLNNTAISLQKEGFLGINKGNYWGGTCHLQQCRGKDWQVHSYSYTTSYKFAYLYDFIPSGKYKLQAKLPTTNVGGAIAVVATSGNN